MENIDKTKENIKPNETGLEEVETPLEMAEVEEAQRNLEEIDKLSEEEKVKFMDKIKANLKKINIESITVSGTVFAVSAATILLSAFARKNLHEIKDAQLSTEILTSELAVISGALGIILGLLIKKGIEKLQNKN